MFIVSTDAEVLRREIGDPFAERPRWKLRTTAAFVILTCGAFWIAVAAIIWR
jgi:hypothetical protein